MARWKTLTVATAAHGVEAGVVDPSTTSVGIVTATLPRGGHAERILRSVGSGNMAPLATALRKALTVAAIYPGAE